MLGVAGAGTNVQTNEEVAIKLVSSRDDPLGFQHTCVYRLPLAAVLLVVQVFLFGSFFETIRFGSR